MLRSFATAVQGLGMIIAITAGVPWVFMPGQADWAALGFGAVLAVSLLMVVLGGAFRGIASFDGATRRAGAASQVVIVTPRKGRQK